jgi:Ice-binding-like
MHLKLSTTGLLVLMASLGVACGGSDSVGAKDGGPTNDGASVGDAAHNGDAANAGDTAGTSDGMTSDGMTLDAMPLMDGGSTVTPQPVNLNSAGTYAIFSLTGISTVPTSAITGDIGVSPVKASAITGFSLMEDATKVFATSTQVTGKVYAPDYSAPTPANVVTAQNDMMTAYTDAAGRAPDVTELGAGNIGGLTLPRGVYKWSSGLLIPTTVTLAGSATDVWIFQIAQNLKLDNGMSVALTGGAVPEHVFWQVAGAVDIGTTAQFEGVVLCMTAIALETGASIHGRLMAQSAVTLESSTVVQPAN